MSKTPRTDAQLGCVNNHFVFRLDPDNGTLVRGEFAKELEVELNAMKEERDHARYRAEQMRDRFVTAINAKKESTLLPWEIVKKQL